jgi:hypothetical protein
MGFAYTLQGPKLEEISGIQRLYAIIQNEDSGWKRTIPITADSKFIGNTFTSQATLNLCKVQTLVDSVEEATGVHLGYYTLVIVAHISVGGKISGQVFTDTFEPLLPFGFDGLQLSLSKNTSGNDPLQVTKSGLLINSNTVENGFPLLGFTLTVGQVRLFALIGLGIALIGLVALWIFLSISTGRDPDAAIRNKYAALLLNVSEHGLESLSPFIDVSDIDELARLAERQNAMIMHLTLADVGYYLVKVDRMAYRFISIRNPGIEPSIEPGHDQE